MAKSNFSFLTGASHPEELVDAAIAQGLNGLALSDLNGMYGVAKAFRKAKHYPDFKFIVGSELTFSDHPPVYILCQTRKAYGHLCRILTHSHADKEKNKAFLHWKQFQDLLQEYSSEGLIAIPRPLKNLDLQTLKNLFPGRLYLPLVRYLDGHDKKRQQEIFRLRDQYQVPIVASNDVYYHVKERKLVQDVLISIRETCSLEQAGYALFSNAERYIKSPKQMEILFKDIPEALENTVRIADSCTFSLKELKYIYPSEWIPQGHSAQTYLESLIWQHAPEIYKGPVPEDVKKQLLYEIKLIGELNYADYFLTIYDIVNYARGKGILCQGRGSAANSVICYVLGITAIDPVKMDFLFERFISVERNEPPDIDVDFEHERREEVIQYIYKKYGRHRAGMVSAVVTYQRRSAFREVCKAFSIPVGTLSAKKVERDFDELSKNFEDPQGLRSNIDSIASEIAGFPRHLSIHSGGFTLSASPITEIVPVEPAAMEGRTIIQWDKYDLDELGLLKVDILSLGMLSALNKALTSVGKKLYEIPHDDPKTYEMISHRDTVGVFQIESRAQMSMLGRLKPKNFYDLVIEVAIVRPGPIVGNMVHPYLKRRRGLEKIYYPNEKVKSILGKTLGMPLFQEQVMKLAIDLGGFAPGEADQLRRSINAWRTSEPIEKMAKRLMDGLQQNGGLSREFARQIFDQIQGFSQYGFPESHSASFALLAYASSYLKCHHPAEFACALVNSQPMGFYRNDTILYDAIRHGVKVKPICIHKSVWDCVVEEPGVIRLGFRVMKGFSQKESDSILVERARQPFTSLEDFLSRIFVKSSVLHRLALAGRLSSQTQDERNVLWALLEYENLLESRAEEQMNLFAQNFKSESENTFMALNRFEKIQEDYNAFHLSTQGHPMRELRKQMSIIPDMDSHRMRQLPHKRNVRIAGLALIRQKPPTAKGVVFCTMEDEFGFIDVVLHPPVFEKYKEVFLRHCFIIVEGALQRDENTLSILAKKIEAIWSSAGMEETPLAIEPDQYFY